MYDVVDIDQENRTLTFEAVIKELPYRQSISLDDFDTKAKVEAEITRCIAKMQEEITANEKAPIPADILSLVN